MASDEDLKAEIERLRAENEALKKPARGQMSLKVSEKGGLSVYGLGRLPVTLYKSNGKSCWRWPTRSARSSVKTTVP
jgi:hypothetical protein